MKDGWEIKKLGEVCELYQPKTISSEQLITDGNYPVYGANGIIGRYNDYNHEESEVLVTCRGATCGTINVSVPYSWINGNAMVVHPTDISKICKQYLRYVLTSIDWKHVITGAAQPQITRQSLSPISIPIPPLPEQERIVSELDCINGILEKKREQIKELDALAQSIFYHMFGDPVTNEKGWEVKKLGEVCKNLFAGGDVPKENFSPQETDEYNIPIYSNGVGDKALYGYTNISRVEDVSLTISGRGTIGYCELRTPPFFPVVRLIVATPHDYIDAVVLKFILNAMDLKGTGGAIPQLTVPMVKSLPIILPPLPLQQSFATKIEAIEKQKELIKRSIAEVETLLASRMQHYFG